MQQTKVYFSIIATTHAVAFALLPRSCTECWGNIYKVGLIRGAIIVFETIFNE